MPPKKPVTTRRGQYHKIKSFRINLVKDATLEKIDSNILRFRPEMFEKKQVMFEKRNSDPSYFRETLCNEFPSLQGKEFSLWRLGCTTASKETKTSLIPLPLEINNAAALCECEELNRSRLYIKLQAAPGSHPVPSPQPHSLHSADEDDSSHTVSSSSKLNNVPDLLPTETNIIRSFPSPQPNHEYPVWTFIQTSDNNGDLQFQSLTTQSWQTVSATDINKPLETAVPLNQQPFTSQYYPEKDNQLLDMTSRVEVSSSRDTENRHPKKRRFLLENANNCEPTAYTDMNGPVTEAVDDMEAMKQTPNSHLMSFGLLPNGERTTFLDVGSYTALLSDHTLIPEMAQQTGTLDNGYSHQIYPNPPVVQDLQNTVNEGQNLRVMSGYNNSFRESLNAWDSIATNTQSYWHQDRLIQTTDSLRTDHGEVIATFSDSITQAERWTNLLKKHMEFLVDRMDPDFGLLDVMVASKGLTMAEFHQIRSQPSTIEDRNRKLLDYVIGKREAEKLLQALEKAKQMHLVNYMNSDSEFREDYCEFWPLLENELEKLITNRQALIDGLDLSYLSFKLYFKDIINKRQHEFILSKPTNSDKNEALLEMLRRGSMKQYKQTIDCLQELNQDRIANILRESGGNQMQVIMQHEGMEKEQLTKQPEHERKEKEPLHCNGSAHQFQEPGRLSDMESNQQEMELEIANNQPNGERLDNQKQNDTDDFPERYKSDPVLVQTIITKAQEKMKTITGLTILDKELFVVSTDSSEVEVYDSMNFSFIHQWNLKELIDPNDLVSCDRNKCLYIFDDKGDKQSKEILRVDPNGKLIKNWSTGYDCGHGLSVTHESNVILTVTNKNKLNEYSPDGQLIREINLLSQASICNPMHTVKLTNGNFMVSHGLDGRSLNRVCVVDAGGKLKKSFGRKAGLAIDQVDSPFNMVVDGNGFVMVADRENGRVLLLNSDLQFKKEILSKGKHGLHYPWRIRLDESYGRLFVTDIVSQRKGRILIFEFR